jgi:oligoendopeptidase F
MPARERTQIPEEHRWDLSGLYADDNAWERAFSSLKELYPPQSTLRGKLGDSPEILAQCLELLDDLKRALARLCTYAMHRADTDTSDCGRQNRLDRYRKRYAEVHSEICWIRPEILRIPEETLKTYMSASVLRPHKRTLQSFLRELRYTLSDSEERLLALSREALNASRRTYERLGTADVKSLLAKNRSENKSASNRGNHNRPVPLTDRDKRRDNCERRHSVYESLMHTLSSTLAGVISANVFVARARGHATAIEAAMYRDHVDIALYESLVKSARKALPVAHKFYDFYKARLGLEDLKVYDLHLSIVPEFSLAIPFEQAFEWIVESVAPLGVQYQSVLKTALNERWIDRYPSRGKRSGAYCGGCYDSKPFILMNYRNDITSALTLAHELGHAMHSYLSNANQPHCQAAPDDLLFEMTAGLNESLLCEHLLKTADNDKLRAYLLHERCLWFVDSIVRPAMFAEFEKNIYAMAESGTVLTANVLRKSYAELNKVYYGDAVSLDHLIEMEWARIHHFYDNFYVYKYPIGYCVGDALASRIIAGEGDASSRYLDLLKAGESKDPMEILRDVGVDLRSSEVLDIGQRYSHYVGQLDAVLHPRRN